MQESIRVNQPPEDNGGDVLSLDTTVQEKNITYPTDDKLYKKIILKCRNIALKEGIELRQSYSVTIKKLSFQQRFKTTKYGAKQARKANKKIKIIAGRLVREIIRKLDGERLSAYWPQLTLFTKVLAQKRSDSHKIYSLHEPDVKCYSKGKEHKKFEFGSKASILVQQSTGIIMGAINFTETLHDSKTIPAAIDQYERLNSRIAKEIFVDRGYRGIKQYNKTMVYSPEPNKNISLIKRVKHSKRAAIEPIIGHLKKEFRLCRNFLKGVVGDNMNVMLAAAAMNFKRVMNLWRTEAKNRWLLIYNFLCFCLLKMLCPNYSKKQKLTF